MHFKHVTPTFKVYMFAQQPPFPVMVGVPFPLQPLLHFKIKTTCPSWHHGIWLVVFEDAVELPCSSLRDPASFRLKTHRAVWPRKLEVSEEPDLSDPHAGACEKICFFFSSPQKADLGL